MAKEVCTLLSGSIVFYWVDSASPTTVATEAHALGIRSMAVKVGDSGVLWPQYKAMAPYLDREGIDRPAWAYVRPSTLDGDVQVAKAAQQAGASAYIADMESPYLGEPAAARLFGRLLRARLGTDYPIYVTTFSGPGAEPSFPWEEVATWADGLIPEWYAGAYPGGSAEQEAQTAYSALTRFGKPILPAGAVYGSATETDVRALETFARSHNLPAVFWWRWGSCASDLMKIAASVTVSEGDTGRPKSHGAGQPVRARHVLRRADPKSVEAQLRKRLDALERRMHVAERALGIVSKDLRDATGPAARALREVKVALHDLGANGKVGAK